MTVSGLVFLGAVLLFVYSYFGYPAILWLLGRFSKKTLVTENSRTRDEWPLVSITIPAYNEISQIRDLLETLLAVDYPRDRLQILVVSDASTDGTDEVVAEYADRGILLHRMPERGGKTKAENAAAKLLTGDIIVNTDASIRIAPDALKRLIAVFDDPAIGLASGRDVSVGPGEAQANLGESGYVGYEMAVRDLETKVSGIIGASGCFYAIKPELHRLPLPEALSRDFASALFTRENGYRGVSVPDAVCYVPRTASLKREYRRKVRTITRGMETLWHKRALMNPFVHPLFAWMLFSHKLCRWALPWAAFAALVALGWMAPSNPLALVLTVGAAAILVLAAVGWVLADSGNPPRIFSLPAFLVAGNVAAAAALVRAIRGDENVTWDPTPRESVKIN